MVAGGRAMMSKEVAGVFGCAGCSLPLVPPVLSSCRTGERRWQVWVVYWWSLVPGGARRVRAFLAGGIILIVFPPCLVLGKCAFRRWWKSAGGGGS